MSRISHDQIERDKLFIAFVCLIAGAIGIALALSGFLSDTTTQLMFGIAGAIIVLGSLVWSLRIVKRSATARGDAAEEAIWRLFIELLTEK